MNRIEPQLRPSESMARAAPLEKPRDFYENLRSEIVRNIALAKTMEPNNRRGKNAVWNYHGGFGWGTLFVTSDKGNICAVNVAIPGESNDVSQADLDAVYGLWKVQTTGDTLREFQHVAIVRPHPIDYREGRYPYLNWFFYTSTKDDIVRLEQFGSDNYGWYELQGLGSVSVPEMNVEYEYTNLPVYINGHSLAQYLHNQMKTDYVISQNFPLLGSL